jgi:hypothetical protein
LLDVTLAFLKGKDAESEEAQEHANKQQPGALRICPYFLIGRHVVCLMGGRGCRLLSLPPH